MNAQGIIADEVFEKIAKGEIKFDNTPGRAQFRALYGGGLVLELYIENTLVHTTRFASGDIVEMDMVWNIERRRKKSRTITISAHVDHNLGKVVKIS